MATDRGSPALVGSATLTVMVIDTNDNRPTIPQPWELRVSEGEGRMKQEVRMAPGVRIVLQSPFPWVLQMHCWAQRSHR
jgi:hypothetical protein